MRTIVFFLLLLTFPSTVNGFQFADVSLRALKTTTATLTTPTTFTFTSLSAKKAGKTSKRKRAAGGFGSSVAKKKAAADVDDDYAIFPKLEPTVMQTMVASTSDQHHHQPGELAKEIYDRLKQIYGFGRFNYEVADTEDVSKKSMTDILSTTEASPLDKLLSSEESSPSPSPSPSSRGSTSLDLQLDSLPPFSKFRVLHVDPLVLAVDDFFDDFLCDRYVEKSLKNRSVMKSQSPTVGKDAAAKAQRTSTTFYHHYKDVPELMAKATRLLGLETIDHWEEPQTVRYRRNERFTWHLDALGPAENQQHLGGQRTVTLLVYLTGLEDGEGGATMFRDLKGADNTPLKVQPSKGSCLLFFPAAAGIPDTPFDIRTLHCGEAVSASASQDKWIAQLWLREGIYKPTAPPGNEYAAASDAISDYVTSFQ